MQVPATNGVALGNNEAVGHDPEEWLTPQEAASEMRCGVDYVWRLCREARLKRRKKGRHHLIKLKHVHEYEDAQVEGGE